MIGNFISSNLAISFYLNAFYQSSWSFASLFVYLSIRKQMSDKEIIWTYFYCFLGCLRSRLTNAKGVKGADVGGF